VRPILVLSLVVALLALSVFGLWVSPMLACESLWSCGYGLTPEQRHDQEQRAIRDCGLDVLYAAGWRGWLQEVISP